ncbi:MAG TPA: hypothetical protein VGS27_18380 [Candidatus Sulfotelmatobacter sp.]|nr:hypothetical protein [Candidatus Sulfotelmatobacter sp.]
MRSKLFFATLLVLCSAAYAQDPKPYQTGKLLQVDAVPCSNSHGSQQALCQQYVLETDSVVFHIRPKQQKHAVVLPVHERAQFRIEKGNLMMHMDGVDNKEREYVIVSLGPRSETSSADAAPLRVNHLQ